ncbi:MAG: transposase [Gammaproteobacteria bacterium]|nr:transposase [Gammaproteobacteria bacterium]
MTVPRYKLIDRENGGYYHVGSRCVRRAWLCGRDPLSGRDFSHRRRWIEDRLLALAELFTVKVYSYVVMSNHYHIGLHYCPQKKLEWDDEEVARRWLTLYPPMQTEHIDAQIAALAANSERIAELRERLGDLSWYMRCLNEPIARRANQEDDCTGRFWDGRFASNGLPDERALRACMAYQDLNPIRAGMANRVDAPEHTSLQRRLEEAADDPERLDQPISPLCLDTVRELVVTGGPSVLDVSLRDYRDQVEWTAGVQQVEVANERAPPTLGDPKSWLVLVASSRRRIRRPTTTPRWTVALA